MKLTPKSILMALLFISVPFFVSAQQVRYGSGVETKMNENKQAGKSIYSGLDRVYVLELDGCGTAEKAKITIGDISGGLEIRKVEFISSGKIKVVVAPEVSYTQIKEALRSNGISIYSLVEEWYFIASK